MLDRADGRACVRVCVRACVRVCVCAQPAVSLPPAAPAAIVLIHHGHCSGSAVTRDLQTIDGAQGGGHRARRAPVSSWVQTGLARLHAQAGRRACCCDPPPTCTPLSRPHLDRPPRRPATACNGFAPCRPTPTREQPRRAGHPLLLGPRGGEEGGACGDAERARCGLHYPAPRNAAVAMSLQPGANRTSQRSRCEESGAVAMRQPHQAETACAKAALTEERAPVQYEISLGRAGRQHTARQAAGVRARPQAAAQRL